MHSGGALVIGSNVFALELWKEKYLSSRMSWWIMQCKSCNVNSSTYLINVLIYIFDYVFY